MRLIDWGILLPNSNSNNNFNANLSHNSKANSAHNSAHNSGNNSKANSAHNSAHNSGNNLQNSINKKMINSLSRFYYNIRKLINRVKVWIKNEKIKNIIENFLKIPNFEIYNPDNDFEGRILNQQEINSIRMEMERLIAEI